DAQVTGAGRAGLGCLLAIAKERSLVVVPSAGRDPCWTAADQELLDSALALAPGKILKVLGGCEITPAVLARCQAGQLGNDEIVNGYLWLVTRRAALSPVRRRILCLSSFWYTTLCKPGDEQPFSFDRVCRWTAKVDIFEYDLVCVPILDGAHWSLVVLYPNLQVAEFRDSLQGAARSYDATRNKT
ncbi:MAG: hypothetical protein GY856_31785, partial [bacterium]|nr:hypothetical protein [bacterium]